MALIFSITLLLSIVGLTLLLGIKRYELNTGRMVLKGVRPAVRRVVHTAVLYVEYLLPFLARRSLAHAARVARVVLSRAAARMALFVEETLHHALLGVEHMMQPRQSGGAASGFLEEVAEHKRKLLRKPPEHRAIFEKYQ
jgi:hypothetical protein